MSIEIENLSFSYGDNLILNDISLTVPTGKSIGIIGTSGGGKSTFLKLICGLIAVQCGTIRIAGAESPPLRRKAVAVVMQNAMLLPASIRDNITCGHEMPLSHMQDACEAAQLIDWIATLPQGLDSFVGERGGQISGGQAQRICIARAIAKGSNVILLDEPTSALDETTSLAVMDALRNLTKNKTVIQVSHRTETLTSCDTIYRLEGGVLLDS